MTTKPLTAEASEEEPVDDGGIGPLVDADAEEAGPGAEAPVAEQTAGSAPTAVAEPEADAKKAAPGAPAAPAVVKLERPTPDGDFARVSNENAELRKNEALRLRQQQQEELDRQENAYLGEYQKALEGRNLELQDVTQHVAERRQSLAMRRDVLTYADQVKEQAQTVIDNAVAKLGMAMNIAIQSNMAIADLTDLMKLNSPNEMRLHAEAWKHKKDLTDQKLARVQPTRPPPSVTPGRVRTSSAALEAIKDKYATDPDSLTADEYEQITAYVQRRR